jgi:hypothetical protein
MSGKELWPSLPAVLPTSVKRRATSNRASSAAPLAASMSAKDLSGSLLLPAQVDRCPALLRNEAPGDGWGRGMQRQRRQTA